jgi:hypothetical protein
MSIAYLDPGNIESDLQSGTLAEYKVYKKNTAIFLNISHVHHLPSWFLFSSYGY